MAREGEARMRRQPIDPVALLLKLIFEHGGGLPMMDFKQQDRLGLGDHASSSPQHFNLGPFDINLDHCGQGMIFSKRIQRHGLYFDRAIIRSSAVR